MPILPVMERRVFRIFFWQRLRTVFVLPFFAAILYFSPITSGWGGRGWAIAGAITAAGVVLYLWSAWRKSAVSLDEAGFNIDLPGGPQTWPYAKLINVRQFGAYRVKMCWDPGQAGKHYHITVDLMNSTGFVEELLARYEQTTGEELMEPEEHAA